jgi:hypothetical protein
VDSKSIWTIERSFSNEHLEISKLSRRREWEWPWNTEFSSSNICSSSGNPNDVELFIRDCDYDYDYDCDHELDDLKSSKPSRSPNKFQKSSFASSCVKMWYCAPSHELNSLKCFKLRLSIDDCWWDYDDDNADNDDSDDNDCGGGSPPKRRICWPY